MIKKTGFFCIAILAMSCMFFAGQSWAQCSGPVDSDGDGITDDLDPCDTDITNECFFETPDACETFIGPNPVAPTATNCGTAQNQPCVVKYKFCANGSATKDWEPVPGSAMPGPFSGTGTWTQVGRVLTITTTDPDQMSMGMLNVEDYDTAFVYYDSVAHKTKLDLNGVAKATSGVPGSYARNSTTHATMPPPPGTLFMDLVGDSVTSLTVQAGGSWSGSVVIDITCQDPGMPGLCAAYGDTNTPISGTTSTDPSILKTPGSLYILQYDTTLLLTRQ
jgi:hypothetical protein